MNYTRIRYRQMITPYIIEIDSQSFGISTISLTIQAMSSVLSLLHCLMSRLRLRTLLNL